MIKIIKKQMILFVVIVFIVNLLSATSEAAETTILTINGNKFVADTLNGVNSLYRPRNLTTDGRNTTYSCAAFVKKYYKEVYGVNAYNFFYNKVPISYEGEKFILVTKPQIGDIAACNTNHRTTHWAIVKEVNGDNSVTLIEQNWKWTQNGKTVTKINRSVDISTTKFYRLQSENINVIE